MATQEVPMNNIWKIYAIELFGSMSTDEAWRHLRTLHFYPEYIDIDREYVCKSLSWLIEYYNS